MRRAVAAVTPAGAAASASASAAASISNGRCSSSFSSYDGSTTESVSNNVSSSTLTNPNYSSAHVSTAASTAPSTIGGSMGIKKHRHGRKRTGKNKARIKSSLSGGSIIKSPPPSSILLTVLIGLFVVTDLIYLYRLSSQALYDNNDIEKTAIISKPTHLSRIVNSNPSFRGSSSYYSGGGITAVGSPAHTNINANSSGAHSNMLYDDALRHGYTALDDKERIFEILQQAGLDIDDFDQETIDELPTWTQVTSLYGQKPYIIGLEQCDDFVDATDPTVRFFGIAGTFNSGTNLVHELMAENCQITERMVVYGNESRGIRWQVPWGKHYPASHRGKHSTRTDKVVPVTNSLPLVAIRDPWMWLQSMCRHHYTALWPHGDAHCPNLVATDNEIENFPRLKQLYYKTNIEGLGEKIDEPLIPVTVKYDKDVYNHGSLAHFWSEWYRLYLDADFPRIMVRFEDMLFHAKEVIEQLCECGGGVPREDRPPGRDFVHISESAKLGTAAHGRHKTNLLGAIIRYGTFEHRLDGVTIHDLSAGKKYFDADILETFGYRHPTPDDLLPSASES